MIEAPHISHLNDLPESAGRHVLYWIQASHRATFNPALEYAIDQANALSLPLLVGFGLTDDYPEANQRHYRFMLEGLAQTGEALRRRGIALVIRRGRPDEVAIEVSHDAALIVCDRGYTRHQKRWRDHVADEAKCPVTQVEGDVVVPVEAASDKLESAARTLRPKIHRLLDTYLKPIRAHKLIRPSLKLKIAGDIDWRDIDGTLAKLRIDRTVPFAPGFVGGEVEAQKRLARFLKTLPHYATARREPAAGATSTLSPYLHFGQISPVQIALAVRRSRAPQESKDAFLEELIVRRELAANFVHYHPHYDTYDALPAWAQRTLAAHTTDPRPYRYTRQQLKSAETHDPYWNAAQRQMLLTGYMHNSMRMYWGKKIIEWSPTPQEAFATALYLNNKYFLDGRDPASFANVAWLFGLHDRPWQGRPIFGMVRYMNSAGLERKFDMAAYVQEWHG